MFADEAAYDASFAVDEQRGGCGADAVEGLGDLAPDVESATLKGQFAPLR